MLVYLMLILMMSDVQADECIKVETSVTGDSMVGLLWDGQLIEVLGLGCGTPQRYDYIVFRLDGDNNPIIKQLWGLPGDTLEVMQNNRFQVNGIEVKTPYNRPYMLLGSARTRMKKLIDPLDGFLVLGHPGSIDSTKVGLIATSNILGYVPRGNIPSRSN